MKNLFAVAAVAALFVACSSNNANTENACCADSTACCEAAAACCNSAAVDSTVADSAAVADSTVAEAPVAE